MSFTGRTAIVTGGASGIGRALADALAARGVTVVVADRQVDLATQVASGMSARAGVTEVVHLDVRDPDMVTSVIQDVVVRHGRLDYLFNNAGIGVIGEMRHFSLSDWSDVIDVDLMGTIHGISAAYPIMVRQGFGHIVNTASLAGLVAVPYIGSYAVSKYGVVGLSRVLRLEAERHGVRVSVLCPGIVRTPMLHGNGPNRVNADAWHLRAHQALIDRMACDPRAVAQAALRAVDRNCAVIVLPRRYRAWWYLERLLPGATDWLTRRAMRRLVRTDQGGT